MTDLSSLFSKERAVTMTAEEKQKTWDHISTSVLHVPATLSPFPYVKGTVSTSIPSTFISKKKKYTAGIIIGSLLFSGGISAFAEQSLPGDFLYPVKVGVLEKAQSLFAIRTEARASLAITLTSTRLEEMEELVIQNRLTPEAKKEIEGNINLHISVFQKNISLLENSNSASQATELRTTLYTELSVHKAVLASLTKGTSILSVATLESDTTENQIAYHIETVTTTSTTTHAITIDTKIGEEYLNKLKSKLNIKDNVEIVIAASSTLDSSARTSPVIKKLPTLIQKTITIVSSTTNDQARVQETTPKPPHMTATSSQDISITASSPVNELVKESIKKTIDTLVPNAPLAPPSPLLP